MLGRSLEAGGSGDPAGSTAVGVFHGIRACVRRVFAGDIAGCRVLVQGVGAVGSRLAELLHEAGATLLLADLAEARAAETAARVGGELVPVHHVSHTECDVYAPCSIGGVLSAESIPMLRCRGGGRREQPARDALGRRAPA